MKKGLMIAALVLLVVGGIIAGIILMNMGVDVSPGDVGV